MQAAQAWLQSHFSDGCNITIKELLNYRGKTGLLNLSPSKTIQSKLAGSYVTKTKGRGMEFDEARHYQPGDDIRAIDWRVTARTGKTHTKLYREERERPVFILVDFSSSLFFGTQLMFKSVQIAHLASLIAWSAATRGDRIGGLVFNQQAHKEFKPLTRQKAVLSLLSGITELHQQGLQNALGEQSMQSNTDGFSEACARLRRLARPGSTVFVLSDFLHLSEKATQHLSRIGRHCEMVAYQVSDPFEHHLPQVSVPQNVSLTDGVNSQTITLGEAKTAKEYELAHQQMNQYVESTLKKCQIKHLHLSSAQSLESQLTAGAK